MRLEQWEVVIIDDIYQAPEMVKSRLQGKIYGSPKHEDGKEVVTSHIVMLDVGERVCRTAHSTYFLGNPSEHWLEYLNKNGFSLDQYNKK